MSRNDEAIISRLTELYNSTDQSIKKLPLDSDTKYALFSDLHLGDGGESDIFVHNEKTMILALEYYKENGYSIILLGDIEEMWQFDFFEIYRKYNKSIYELLRKFQEKNKVFRIFGNHDKDWERSSPIDPIFFNESPQYRTPEAIKLGNDIFLVHGHQGDKTCDKKIWVSRFLARVLKPYVPHGKALIGYANYSATKSQIPEDREKLYYNWAKDNKVILICGHTHNAIFASKIYYWWLKEQIKQKKSEIKQCSKDKIKLKNLLKEIKDHEKDLIIEELKGRRPSVIISRREKFIPCYFNTGCGHFRDGITNIEIESGKIRLIKWKKNKSLPLERKRKVLWKEKSLSEIRKKIK